jgi:hypothetical protein
MDKCFFYTFILVFFARGCKHFCMGANVKCAEHLTGVMYNMSIYLEIKDVSGLEELTFDELFSQLFIDAVKEEMEQVELPEAFAIQSSWETVARHLEHVHQRREKNNGIAEQ